jgi:hypothetical protein
MLSQLHAKLGFQYLWIDSLCIVQDSPSDWDYASSQMATIYRNSFLTIAATRSTNGSGGFFFERNKDYTCLRRYPISGSENNIFLSRKLPLHMVKELFQDGTTKYPLHARAWAFQERLLSPRIIQYTEGELVWECKTRTRCECTLFDVEDDGEQYVSSSDFRTYKKRF